jgi:hypothetical protein
MPEEDIPTPKRNVRNKPQKNEDFMSTVAKAYKPPRDSLRRM